MSKTIIVFGHGPGISNAVAHRFGREGYTVAIVARNADRLEAAAKSLNDAGVKAKAFACDLASPDAVRKLVRDVRTSLGPIDVLHWNAYGKGAGDLTTATADELRSVLDVSVTSLVAAAQEALPDLKATKGAILVTGGGFAFYDPKVDGMAVEWGAMGVAVSKAAQHKTVGLLRAKLAGDSVYVGEVVVLGMVKGTAFDSGHATIEPSTVADRFWDLFDGRSKEASVTLG